MTTTRTGTDGMETLKSRTLALRIERVIRDGGVSLTRAQLAGGGGIAGFDAVGSRFNRIYGLGLEGPCTPEALQQLIDFLDRQGVSRPGVETSPASHPGTEAALQALGFEVVERLEVLVRHLAAAPEPDGDAPGQRGVRIERVDVQDQDRLRAFVELFQRAFNPEQTSVPERTLQESMRAVQNPEADLFEARLDDRPVGAAQSSTRDGVTILYGASVLEPFRRRGAQQALVQARLARAWERGSDLVTVFCERESATFRNAERMGFTRAYTRLQWKQPER